MSGLYVDAGYWDAGYIEEGDFVPAILGFAFDGPARSLLIGQALRQVDVYGNDRTLTVYPNPAREIAAFGHRRTMTTAKGRV